MLRLLFICMFATGVCHACDCGPRPACGDIRGESRYFIGVPIHVRIANEHPPDKWFGPTAIYEVRITESLSSSIPRTGTIEVRTGTGGADCSWHFQLGKTYFFEANPAGGRLYTGLCHLTGLVEDREVYLRSLRDIRDHRRPASLLASVLEMKVFGKVYAQLPQITVTARGENGVTFRAMSDDKGIATFDHLPTGGYDLSAAFPKSIVLEAGWSADSPHIVIPSGSQTPVFCRAYIEGEPSGRVSGRVIAPRSLLGNATVTISPVAGGETSEIAVDTRTGEFSSRSFEAGTYRVTLTSGKRLMSSYTKMIEVHDATLTEVTLERPKAK